MTQRVDFIADVAAAKRRPDPAAARETRLELGISQSRVARALGVSPSAISRWETGVSRPRLPVLREYLEILDLMEGEQS